jgi:type II secretory pathway predicted ATPase ExeA
MLPIYCEHFNLKREPFNITPDPGFLYLSESHKEALAQLVYGIKGRRGFVVLTGEVGTGKTTMIHCLLNELNGNTKTAMVFNMVVSAKDLLRYVCEKFGIATPQDAHKEIHDYLYLLEQFLIDSYRNGTNAALIIDEAQNLSTEVLENVRLLSNFETANDKLLQIFLVGQPELGARLNASELRQLKQRVALRYHLRPLSLVECRDYIARRLEVANGNISLFTPEAIEFIHAYSGGIPRVVNILCDNGLLTAYALRKRAVESPMIEEVARDLQLNISTPIARKAVGLNKETISNSDRQFKTPPPAAPTAPKIEQPVIKTDSTAKPRPAIVPVHQNVPADTPKIVTRSPEAKSDIPSPNKLASGTVPSRFLDYMISALTEAMGPMASLIVHEQIAAMGESFTAFPQRRVVELIEAATREILSDSAKANCKRAMLEGIRGIANGNDPS